MTMVHASDRVRPLLVPGTQRSLWDTAIRLTAGSDTISVLAELVSRLSEVAVAWNCKVLMSLEPTGDACDTGHWVDIHCEHWVVSAEMTPWPDRHCGVVPPEIDAELASEGWVLIASGADPDPLDHQYQVAPSELTEEQQRQCDLPARRLVAVAGVDDLRDWASRVAHAVRRVIAPPDDRWFVECGAEAVEGGALSRLSSGNAAEFDGHWSINLGLLLDPSSWERAVWRSDTEAGAICCALGLHELHEAPCPPPQPWQAHIETEDNHDGRMDL